MALTSRRMTGCSGWVITTLWAVTLRSDAVSKTHACFRPVRSGRPPVVCAFAAFTFASTAFATAFASFALSTPIGRVLLG